MGALPPPLANENVLTDPPPEFKFRPACGNMLENGTGVMVSGCAIGFREIDEIGGSFKDLVDVLSEIANEQKAQEAVDAPNAILRATRQKKGATQ